MVILATSKIYGNYQTSIPKEFIKFFNVDKDSVLEWGVDDGKPTINFRKKRDFKGLIGAFNLEEKTDSVDLKRIMNENFSWWPFIFSLILSFDSNHKNALKLVDVSNV